MAAKASILWVDDEIEMLRPHIIFLEQRDYQITPVPNAEDAISMIREQNFDLVLLDEMLTGMDGLTALNEIKDIDPGLPVVMVTKSEEEALMEDAIGGRIDDYLVKPVNPSQILMTIRKNLDSKNIEADRLSRDYTKKLNQITMKLMNPMDYEDWIALYNDVCSWEVELDQFPDLGMRQTITDQKRECNVEFAKFIERNYRSWVADNADNGPLLSTDIFSKFVIPQLEQKKRVVLVVIDNLRLDQWMAIENLLYPLFNMTKSYYYSILPTATPYSRNAIFSGLFPEEIRDQHPEYWKDSPGDDETSHNRYERQLLEAQLQRQKIDLKPEPKYIKVLDSKESKNLEKNINSLAQLPLLSVVINFVDFLAHSRSDSQVLKEISPDESAYRTLTRSWFIHSDLFKVLKQLAALGNTIIITSDHGSIRSRRGAKVLGDRDTSTNLRYKYGKNLRCDSKFAINVKKPETFRLPPHRLNTNYLIAKEDFYFVYPTDYHHYLNYYKDSLQHGGVSMEEMILPVIQLEAK